MGLFKRISNYAAKKKAISFWKTSIKALKKLESNVIHNKKSQYDIVMLHSLQKVITEMIASPPVDANILSDSKRMSVILYEYKKVLDMLIDLEQAYNECKIDRIKTLVDELIAEFESAMNYD